MRFQALHAASLRPLKQARKVLFRYAFGAFGFAGAAKGLQRALKQMTRAALEAIGG
jgi:hypothetical protein